MNAVTMLLNRLIIEVTEMQALALKRFKETRKKKAQIYRDGQMSAYIEIKRLLQRLEQSENPKQEATNNESNT